MRNGLAPVLTTDTGEFVATHRHFRRGGTVAVDPADAGLNLVNHPVCPADIIGEHARGKSGFGIVGPGNHLVFVAEGEHRHHRPEDLFLHDGHVVGAVGENGRFHEIAARRILRLKGPTAVA